MYNVIKQLRGGIDMPQKFTLRQWRNIRGLSQEELAERVGVTARTIVSYEKNAENLGNARYITVQKIADELDIKLSDIFLELVSDKPN